jgi:hypothetical protein
MGFNMDDYKDVAERIAEFYEKYPEGSFQTLDWRVITVDGTDKNGNQIVKTFVTYHAAAYRHAEDPHPAHGIAWELFPGPTPYTKDSELMNAETSAWGRAAVAAGLSTKKIASKNEVLARQEEEDFATRLRKTGVKANEIKMYLSTIDAETGDRPLAEFLNDMNPEAQAALLEWAKGDAS